VEGKEFFITFNELYIDDNKLGVIDHKKDEHFLDWYEG